MAIWQFNLVAIPRQSICSFFQCVPQHLEDEVLDTRNWWNNVPEPDEQEFASLLPKSTSWSKSIKAWGTEDGHRIELHFNKDCFFELTFRIDLRQSLKQFLDSLLFLAKKHDYLFITEEGVLLEPTREIVLRAIQKSSAFSFVENPRSFLDQL